MRRATNAADIRNTFLLMIRQLSYFDESIVYIRQERNLLSFGKLGLMRDSIAKDASVEEVLFCMCDEVSPQLGITGIILTYNCMYIKASNASLQVSFDKVRSIYADGSSFFVNDHEFKFSPKFRLLKELVDVVKDSIARCDFSYCPLHVEKYESENDVAEGNESEKDNFEQNITQRNETINENVTCNSCGAKIAVGSKFCPECGAKQNFQTVCPNCGFQNGSVFKFCPECGCASSSPTTQNVDSEYKFTSELEMISRRVDELINVMTTDSLGKEAFYHPQLFFNSIYYKVFSIAFIANRYNNNELIEMFYALYGDLKSGLFSQPAEEYFEDLENRLTYASEIAIIECNAVLEIMERNYKIDLSNEKYNVTGWKDLYFDVLENELQSLKSCIREFAECARPLSKVLVDSYSRFENEQKGGFLERNFDFFAGFFKGAVAVYTGNILPLIGSFFNSGDPEAKRLENDFKSITAQMMYIAESCMNASSRFEQTLSGITLQVLKNPEYFKSIYIEHCKILLERSFTVNQILAAINERIDMHRSLGVSKNLRFALDDNTNESVFVSSLVDNLYSHLESLKQDDSMSEKIFSRISEWCDVLQNCECRLFYPYEKTPSVKSIIRSIEKLKNER